MTLTTMVLASSTRLADHSDHCLPKTVIPLIRADKVSHTLNRHPPSQTAPPLEMPPVNILSEDSDSGEDLNKITIDEHYAKAFAYRKERQELERRKHT